ncbi:MAG: hypothetical protein ACLUAR_04740 [Pilosibacter sp.]
MYGMDLPLSSARHPEENVRNGFLIFSELRHRSFHFQLSLPWSPDWHAGIFFTDADMVLFLGAQETMSRHWNVPDGATFLQKVVAYGIAGFFVVLAGMTYTNTCNGADANSSVNYNMMSIATVILGGCDMAGGLPVPVGSRYGSDRYESDQFAFNCHEDEFELSDCYHRTYPDRSSCLKVPDS